MTPLDFTKVRRIMQLKRKKFIILQTQGVVTSPVHFINPSIKL